MYLPFSVAPCMSSGRSVIYSLHNVMFRVSKSVNIYSAPSVHQELCLLLGIQKEAKGTPSPQEAYSLMQTNLYKQAISRK